jgi:hypothetical protein
MATEVLACASAEQHLFAAIVFLLVGGILGVVLVAVIRSILAPSEVPPVEHPVDCEDV